VTRRVTRTATIPLEGNSYGVDPALVGRRVELRYDPEDLSRIDVYLNGTKAGVATPFVTRRHTHRAVPRRHGPNRSRRGSTTSTWWQPPMRSPPAPGRRSTSPSSPCSVTSTRSRAREPGTVVAHFGLDRTPFGKSIAAKDLFIRQAHQEAVARINFCIVESAIGVVTGDVGAGKTVSVRAAVSSLDPTRHQVIYIATRPLARGGSMSRS